MNEAYVLEHSLHGNDGWSYSMIIEDLGSGTVQRLKTLQNAQLNADNTLQLEVYVYDADADWQSQPRAKEWLTMTRSGKILASSNPRVKLIPFPTHPVFVGETWRKDSALPLLNPFTDKVDFVPLTYTYTCREIRQQDGRKVARIKTQCPLTEFTPAQDATLSIEAIGETLFAVEDGMIVGSEVETEVVITVAGQEEFHQKLRVRVELLEQQPDARAAAAGVQSSQIK